MSETTYTVSPLTQRLSYKTVRRKMIDVLIALLPATAVGVYYLKMQALLIILVSVLTCVITEAAWQKIYHQEIRIGDFSAVVTGLLIALNLPSTVPLWIPVAGGIFAIIFVKQVFGGIGQNFMNPALAARAFLLAAWAGPMSKTAVDAGSSASQKVLTLMETFKGPIGVYIGELSVAALLIGGLYLVIRRVITLRVPLAYVGTVFVMSWMLGEKGFATGDPVRGILSGALMIGAFFMATDPSTCPTTAVGQYVMGIGCGILTSIFSIYGHNPEGFVYAILIMNLVAPLIEKYTTPKKHGEVA